MPQIVDPLRTLRPLREEEIEQLTTVHDAVATPLAYDVYRSGDELVIEFDAPGVAPEDIEVRLDPSALTVSALRRVQLPGSGAVIRRLEIPHGRFVRQIALPGSALRIAESHYLNGCLEVRLVRAQRSE